MTLVTSVSALFFKIRFLLVAPPSSLIYLLCGPLPFINTVTSGGGGLYFHIVDMCIQIYLYYNYLQCIVFKYFV